MSEIGSTTTSRTSAAEQEGLTEADLARALQTSRQRGSALVRRRQRRMAVGTGVAAALLLVAGVGVVNSLSDDGQDLVVTPAGGAGDKVLAPAETTTTSPPAPTQPLPEGWARTEVDGVLVLTNPDSAPDPTVDAGSGVVLGGGSAQERAVAIVASDIGAPDRLRLEFACVRGADDHIDQLLIQRAEGLIRVEATITGTGDGSCTDGGAKIEVTFPEGGLTADQTVEAGLLG